MTNFLHWRKGTWALVLWSGYVAAWMVIVEPGAAMAVAWWLAGMIVFCSLWLATQPLLQRGRGLNGVFVRPGKVRSAGLEDREADGGAASGR